MKEGTRLIKTTLGHARPNKLFQIFALRLPRTALGRKLTEYTAEEDTQHRNRKAQSYNKSFLEGHGKSMCYYWTPEFYCRSQR